MAEPQKVSRNCPFNEKECGKGKCALYMNFEQRMGTVTRRMGACVFIGTNIVLSEMNAQLKQQGKPQIPTIMIPGNGGRG